MGYYHTWRIAVSHVYNDVMAEFEVWLETQGKVASEKKAYLFRRIRESKDENLTPEKDQRLVYGNDWKYQEYWDVVMDDVKKYCDHVGLAWSYVNIGESLEDFSIEHGDSGYPLLDVVRTIEDVKE